MCQFYALILELILQHLKCDSKNIQNESQWAPVICISFMSWPADSCNRWARRQEDKQVPRQTECHEQECLMIQTARLRHHDTQLHLDASGSNLQLHTHTVYLHKHRQFICSYKEALTVACLLISIRIQPLSPHQLLTNPIQSNQNHNN